MGVVGSQIGRPFGRRLPVSVGSAVVRTYAEWVTQANLLATGGALAWEAPTATLNAGSFTTTPSAATGGVLTGSSWNTFFKGTASAASAERIVQHGVQNTTILSALRAGSFVAFLRIVGADASAGYVALDRNGYLSLSGAGNNLTGRVCDLLIRWDDTVSKAFQSNPSIGGAETEYTW